MSIRKGKSRKTNKKSTPKTHKSTRKHRSQVVIDQPFRELKMDTHTQAYRGMSLQQLINAYRQGYFVFENDFAIGEGVNGSSFTTDLAIAGKFARNKTRNDFKGNPVKDKENLDAIPVVISIRENGLLEDRPLDLTKVTPKMLLENEQLTKHIYALQPHHFKGWMAVSNHDILTSDLMAFDPHNTKKVDHPYNIELAESVKGMDDTLFEPVYQKQREYLEFIDNELYKPEIIQKFIDAGSTPPNKETDTLKEKRELIHTGHQIADIPYFFKSPDDVPYQLYLRNALDFGRRESEIVTTRPTRIGFDDIIIFVPTDPFDKSNYNEEKEDRYRKILLEYIPEAETHSYDTKELGRDGGSFREDSQLHRVKFRDDNKHWANTFNKWREE